MQPTHKTTYLIDAWYGYKDFVKGFFQTYYSSSVGGVGLWTIEHLGDMESKKKGLVNTRKNAPQVKAFSDQVQSATGLSPEEKYAIISNAIWLTFSVIDKEEEVL